MFVVRINYHPPPRRVNPHQGVAQCQAFILHYCRLMGWKNRNGSKTKDRISGAFYHVICRGNQRQVIFGVMRIGSITWNGWSNIGGGIVSRCMRMFS